MKYLEAMYAFVSDYGKDEFDNVEKDWFKVKRDFCLFHCYLYAELSCHRALTMVLALHDKFRIRVIQFQVVFVFIQ